jgi:hypothetical protein
MKKHRRYGLPLLASAVCVFAVACAGGAGDAGAAVSDLLPATPGAGLPATLVTEQRLDVGEAASALPSDSSATSAELSSRGYREGYIRIWGSRSNYATMVILSFGKPSQAAAFRDFERSSMSAGVNTYVTAHAGIPGSFVFVITAPTKQAISSDPVFCNGVWFALQDYAFESLACGGTPAWATRVEQVAQTEYEHAKSDLEPG